MDSDIRSKVDCFQSFNADVHMESNLHLSKASHVSGPIAHVSGSTTHVSAPTTLVGGSAALGPQPVRILIADDGAVFRESLSFFLQSRETFEVVGGCADAKSVVALTVKFNPDILLLDSGIETQQGVDVLGELKNRGLKVKVVLLCVLDSKDLMIAALRRGVRGIALKSEPTEMLVRCIQKVAGGDYWLSKDGVADLVDALCSGGTGKPLIENKYGLTPRENEIISAVLEGYSNPEIAASLSLSEHTVKHHLSNIFDKLGVYSRLELALFALNHNITFK